MLSEETKTRIQKEAEELFPFYPILSSYTVSNERVKFQRAAYITGATKEAEKCNNHSMKDAIEFGKWLIRTIREDKTYSLGIGEEVSIIEQDFTIEQFYNEFIK